MVDSGVVERWEVSDQVREALEWLREATARVVTDQDHKITQPVHQRRQGRGKPLEDGSPTGPPHDVIVVAAEVVSPEEGKVSEQPLEAIVGTAEPVPTEDPPDAIAPADPQTDE